MTKIVNNKIFQSLYYLVSILAMTSIAFFVAPVLILTCIYVRIFAAASKNSRDIRRNSFHQPLMASKEAKDEEDLEKIEDDKISYDISPHPIRKRNCSRIEPDAVATISPTRSAPDLLSPSVDNKGKVPFKGKARG